MKTNVLSFKVASTLLAYRIVGHNGTANTVGYPANAQTLPIGVTIDTVKDATQAIPVAVAGSIARVYFNDSCASGALVQSDTSGRGVVLAHPDTATSSTLAAAYVGILLSAKVESTATVADVFVMPGFTRGSA
jgi:hypothetical protein